MWTYVIAFIVAFGGSASFAETGPVPPRSEGWTQGALNSLYDGAENLQSKADFIIRPESSPPSKAPRNVLNLQAVPAKWRHTIPGFNKLFHKNQEETLERVQYMNGLIREKNKQRRWRKIPEWTYDPTPNEPPFTCLADAAGTVNDWWSMQLNKTLPTFINPSNGAREVGINSHMLELKYYERADKSDPHYITPPKIFIVDPIRHTDFTYNPIGFADILLEDQPYEIQDPITGEVFRYEPQMASMEGQYIQLFNNNIFRPRTPKKYAKTLAQAIDKWGIALVQIEETERPYLSGAHTLAGVGYFCMEGKSDFIDCADNQTDEDWARTTYFIMHDSFGDFPATKIRDGHGAPAYRAIRIQSIDQALVFPHSLRVQAEPAEVSPGLWRIAVTNKGGTPIKEFLITGEPGTEIDLEVEAKHYFEADGKPRKFKIKLEQNSPTAGTEILRSKPRPSYRTRQRILESHRRH